MYGLTPAQTLLGEGGTGGAGLVSCGHLWKGTAGGIFFLGEG